jgi:dTDP-4-amino-4,6-dideoxygalactose transaminase
VPLHLQKCYRPLGYQAGDFPVAEKAARECLSLPIYPELTDKQINQVGAVVHDFFKR